MKDIQPTYRLGLKWESICGGFASLPACTGWQPVPPSGGEPPSPHRRHAECQREWNTSVDMDNSADPAHDTVNQIIIIPYFGLCDMCGITGIYAFEAEREICTDTLQKMASRLAHRGPDDTGLFLQNGVGLGFCRLSIIDLSGGNQPHFNEDRTIVSVCNGEIYNFKELRQELEAKGHRLRTQCDVEVLVHLYEEYGTEFFRRLNGQFAFALSNLKTGEMFLARDPVGIAPLFYTRANEQIIFGSEIKAILAHPDVKREVNLTGLDQILTFPGTVSPTTMFKGIHSLKPGHYLRVQNGYVQIHEYWDLVYPEFQDLPDDPEETHYADRLEETLSQAVRYRLQADVPVGFYLSGGLDSSLVAALIHKACPEEQRHSFSICFPRSEIDERQYQRLLSAQVSSIHHETEFQDTDILARLRDAVYFSETPLKESYNTCSMILSRLVRETGLKVIQTGEGADELFAGYVGYRFDGAANSRSEDPFDVEALLENEIRERLWGDPDFLYEKNYHAFAETKEMLYSEALASSLPDFECTRQPLVDVKKIRNRHPYHKRSYLDMKLRLADHLVSDHGDRMAYANSVEARYPFLDLDVLEYATQIPPALLIRGDCEKYILRRVAERHLPETIMKRQKFAFVAPGSPYLLRLNVDWINDLLSPETIRRQGYFNPSTIERLKSLYLQEGASVNTTFETDLLMIALTFGLFLELFEMPGF